jgi:predicted nucleic acid-binding protein
MAALVLDCSVAIAWFVADEASPSGASLLDRVAKEGALVTGLWRLEVASALLAAERRRRIAAAMRGHALEALEELPITVDGETSRRAWTETLALAVTHKLTPYDAAYLELALRFELPLASYDKDLRNAAAKAGVTVLGR